MEATVTKAEKLASMEKMIAGLAHEINNPLCVILGFCELLLEKLPPESQEYNDLKIIERQGLRCRNLIQKVVRFAGRSGQVDHASDIVEVIDGVLSRTAEAIEGKEITVRVDLNKGLPQVKGSPEQLAEVLFNLVDNAVWAMQESGILTVSARTLADDGWVQVQVSDTGVGIGRERLPKIFDPFFTTRDVGEGSGLGLSLCYWVVNRIGGTIACESFTHEERPGQTGTTFTVCLPALR